jgi:hypothetical protein
MGDEYGHSKNGMVDVDSTSFQWDAVESEFGEQTIHLISTLSAFRKRRKELLQVRLHDLLFQVFFLLSH